jgi:hypothetical protein
MVSPKSSLAFHRRQAAGHHATPRAVATSAASEYAQCVNWQLLADMRCQRPPSWLGLLGQGLLATLALVHSEAQLNSDIFPFPNDLFNGNSNQFQTRFKFI